MTSPRDPAALEVGRERVVQALCHHFAHDRLDEAELERRLGLANAARSAAELDALLAGLPPTPRAGVVPGSSGPARHAGGGDPVTVGARAAGDARPATSTIRVATIVSEARRDVAGEVPARIEVRAVLSDVKLDLSHGSFGDVTEVDCVAVMSSVRILVPPGVRVISEGLPLLGTFSQGERAARDAPLPSDAPVVRLRGTAVMGEVRAKVARG